MPGLPNRKSTKFQEKAFADQKATRVSVLDRSVAEFLQNDETLSNASFESISKTMSFNSLYKELALEIKRRLGSFDHLVSLSKVSQTLQRGRLIDITDMFYVFEPHEYKTRGKAIIRQSGE